MPPIRALRVRETRTRFDRSGWRSLQQAVLNKC
jgi:hypothetical protein